MTQYFDILFNSLIKNAYRPDHSQCSVDLALASFTAISELCENSCDNSSDALYNFLIPILQLLEQTSNPELFTFGEEKAKEFQDYLSGVLQIILVKVGSKVD